MNRTCILFVALLIALAVRAEANMQVVSEDLFITVSDAGGDVYRISVEPAADRSAPGIARPVVSSGGTSELAWDAQRQRITLRLKKAPKGSLVWDGTVRSLPEYGRLGVPGLEIEWAAAPGELVAGLGERFDGFNQYGRKVEMWIRDAVVLSGDGAYSYYCTPVLYSGRGYALFAADNPEGEFDLNSTGDGRHRYRRAGPRATFYLAAGDSLKDLAQKRARVQGPFGGIPDWAWGPWISRNSYENQGEAEEAIRGMVERDIPVAAIVQEAWKGKSETGDFNNFSEERWPDLDAYFALCRQHDIRTILWQVPVIHPSSPEYKRGEEQGFFVKEPGGGVSWREEWLDGFANIDFTKPEAVKFWKDLLRPALRRGTHGFKVDDGEAIKADDIFSDGRRGWQVHNEYSALYNQAVAELLKEEKIDGMIWCRSGSLGIEKCPALWAGDQRATWEHFRALLGAGLSASLSGMAFWGHDIGGYVDNPSPELYIRWLQFGAFSPLMQYHGIARREPWEFGEQAERVYKKLAHLRMNLRPTLIEFGKQAQAGLPIMRPMIMEFPRDRRFDDEATQYMLGPDLLVAPVLEEGAATRRIKFPAGAWQHLLDPVAYDGPCEVEVAIGLESVPVFVREGAKLRVELDKDAELGRWRKGAPVRVIEYGRTRVRLRNPSVDAAEEPAAP
ncbi:MAG: glycoside hydrolase family 31 protein [Kiritimatiellae bacterium]|nr:glycoside hydrolase family 31 protein [Kiritimatiellia bacterium]